LQLIDYLFLIYLSHVNEHNYNVLVKFYASPDLSFTFERIVTIQISTDHSVARTRVRHLKHHISKWILGLDTSSAIVGIGPL
jgi:hypothetical protein